MNKDGTYRIDHLERKGSTDKLWCRPSGWDDIQDTEEIQILPVNVVGDWDFKEEKPTYVITNITDIKDSFNYVCQLFDVWCITWRFVLLWLFFCLNLIFPDEFLLVIRQKLSQTQYLLLK